MIDTTYIRLETAAKMLESDSDTIVIAAAEGRLRLHGLLNQVREVIWNGPDIGDEDPSLGDEDIPDVEEDEATAMEGENSPALGRDETPPTATTRHILFAPLDPRDAADLLTTGRTGELLALTEPGDDGATWEDPVGWHRLLLSDDDPDPFDVPSTSVTLKHVFLRRQDVLEIAGKATPPPTGSVPTTERPSKQNYSSRKLLYLNLAAQRWWGETYKQGESPEPKNDDVAAWLIENGDFSENLALSGASIIRSDTARFGRKPKI